MAELIIAGRREGKTYELIRRCAERKANGECVYIVVPTHGDVERVTRMAREHCWDIGFPIALEELEAHGLGRYVRGLYFDDLDRMVQQLGGSVPVLAATWGDTVTTLPPGEETDNRRDA